MARTFGRCIGCGDALYEPGFRTCSRCAVLLDGIDLTDIPASRGPCALPAPPRGREPGSDDIKPKPPHDAKWLYRAVIKRNKLREAQAIGRRLHLHSNLLCWSTDQVDQVVAALVAAKMSR